MSNAGSGFWGNGYLSIGDLLAHQVIDTLPGDGTMQIIGISVNNQTLDSRRFSLYITAPDGVTPRHYLYRNTPLGSNVTVAGATRYILDGGRRVMFKADGAGVSAFVSGCFDGSNATGSWVRDVVTDGTNVECDLVVSRKNEAPKQLVSISVGNQNDQSGHFSVFITEEDGVTPHHYVYHDVLLGSSVTIEDVTRHILSNGRKLRCRSNRSGISFLVSGGAI